VYDPASDIQRKDFEQQMSVDTIDGSTILAKKSGLSINSNIGHHWALEEF